MLQKASLQKKDLQLELEELEEAATMVAEEEGDSSTSSDSSSSESSDESEESEAEGQGCTESSKGGGGGGGEATKHNPLQPQPTSAASPIPQEPTSTLLAERKAVALPSVSEGSRQLIQELEELRICPDLCYKAETNCSQLSDAATDTDETSGRCSSGTLLEPSPRRNPLLIVQTQDDDDEMKMMMRESSS